MMDFEELVQDSCSTPSSSAVITTTTSGDAADVKLGLGVLAAAGGGNAPAAQGTGPGPGRGSGEGQHRHGLDQRDDALLQDLADLIDQKGANDGGPESVAARGGLGDLGLPSPPSSSSTLTKDNPMAAATTSTLPFASARAATPSSSLATPATSPQQSAMLTPTTAASASPPSPLSSPGGFKPSTATLLRSFVPKELLGSLVLEAINSFMFLVDAGGSVVITSENIDSFLGRSAADVERRQVYDMIHYQDHEKFRALLSEASATPTESSSRLAAALNETAPKVFSCRFRRSRRNGDADEAYESLEVSVVTVKPPASGNSRSPQLIDGRDLGKCRLFCIARKVGDIERSRHFAVEMFTTKLDPFPPTFSVIAVDTTGMNTPHTTAITKNLLRRSLLDLCHADDKVVLDQHLELCMREGGMNHVSPVYRIKLLEGPRAGYVRVKTKSKYFKPCTAMGNPRGFINATHSVVDMAELRYNGENEGLLMAVTGGNRLNPRQQQQQAGGGGGNNNNNYGMGMGPKTSPSAATTTTTTTAGRPDEDVQQKNLLLKQLLNVNYSRGESPAMSSSAAIPSTSPAPSASAKPPPAVPASAPISATSPASSTSSGILKLLTSQQRTSSSRSSPKAEGQHSPPLAGVKRTASGSLLSPTGASSPDSGSGEGSTVCKQNPALISLLSKPTTNSVAVPPPVPTKWHQEPREKLPRSEDGLKKFLPPHPAERTACTSTASPAMRASSQATTATATVLQPRIPTLGVGATTPTVAGPSIAASPLSSAASATSTSTSANPMLDVAADDVLSEILEGVIDIQETNPSGTRPVTTASRIVPSEIESIEKFLVGSAASPSSGSGPTSSSVSGAGFPQQQQQQRHRSAPTGSDGGTIPAPIQTMASSSPSSALAPSNNNQQQLQQRLLQQQQHLARRQNSAPALPSAGSSASVGNTGVGGRRVRTEGGGSPVSLVPRMNDLLQVVPPPNVSIPDCPDLDSIVMLQQRRRMSSGGSSGPSPPGTSRLQLAQRQSSPPTSMPPQSPPQNNLSRPGPGPAASGGGSNQLLMQQLSSGPLIGGPRPQRQPQAPYGNNFAGGSGVQQQQAPIPAGGSVHGYGLQLQQRQQQQQQRYLGPTNSVHGQRAASAAPFQGSMNQQRAMMMRQQGYGSRPHPPPPGGPPGQLPPQQQHPHPGQQIQNQHAGGGGGGRDASRSLLQQLLSEKM